jgi:predicted nucleotidyltransferase
MSFRKETICKIREFEEISEFIDRIVNDYMAIIEIWLFGSRTQGQKKAKDWDLLVVTMDQGTTLSLMGKTLMLKQETEKNMIHLFIHGNDEDALGAYFCPWERTASIARDKFNLREKISWLEPFQFQYAGEHKENIGMCVWNRDSGSDSFLNSHFYI